MRANGLLRSGPRLFYSGLLAYALACPATALGGTVVADVGDGTFLREVEGSARIETRLAASLLLAHVVHQALQAETLNPDTMVAVAAGPAHTNARPDAAHLTVDELLQLLLLTGDRTAAHSLALVLGPGVQATRVRMRDTASRLGLTATSEPMGTEASAAIDRALQTSVRDLARLGLAIARAPDMRRRLDLDGAPIANGRFIVRATDPLIATANRRAQRRVALAIGNHDELEILTVAAGPNAQGAAWQELSEALDRYERRVIVYAGQQVGPLIHVRGGIIPRFTAIAAEQFAVTVHHDTAPHVAARLQLPTHVEAPVDVNEAVGELVIEQQGKLVAVVPLVAPRTIAPRHWLGAMVH